MAYLKPIDGKYAQKGAIPTLTLGTFVQAASVANLLVATLVFIEFSVMSLVNRDGRDFQMGLWLVPFVTMVIWGTATVMCVVALTPKVALHAREAADRRTSPVLTIRKSGVWDDWLDSPEPHGR